jgi:arylsulfatase A-like enzyme
MPHALLALTLAAAPSVTPSPGPPNVVLIVADDLGYGDLASYGHRVLKTPALDRLAGEGIRLTSYYAPSPLCSPSRASLLTGRIHRRTGIESWIPPDTDVQLGPRELTIATLLKQRGYRTAVFGKWHLNGGLDVRRHTQPQDHGFDEWLTLHAWAEPHHRDPTNFFRNGRPVGEIKGYAARIVVDEAMRWLETDRAAAPFLLYLPLVEPHSTIASPAEWNALYAAYTDGRPDPFPNENRYPDNLAARGPGEYYASISHLDHEVGRLLERLDALGLRESSLVIFTSDNGPVTTDWRHWWEVNLYGSTGGFRGRKADLYDGGTRVPFIARWPGQIPAGRVSDVPVIGYDLLPTLAAITGFRMPDDRPIDGEDVSAVLRGGGLTRRQPLYWEFADDQGFRFALRDGDFKLLADAALARVRLYDLRRDRFEVDDRAAREKARVEELLAIVRRIHASVESDPLRPARAVP